MTPQAHEGGMPCRSQIQPFGHPPFLDADHHGFAIALGRIAALPRKHGQAVFAFIVFWFTLPWPERAKLAKVAKPDMTDEEVARLSGVSRRHLIRDDGYQSLKPKLDDFKASRPRSDFSKRRRGFSNPDARDG
jgi:hypothetical protein